MSTYFSMIFEIHHITFRFDVYYEVYTNLSPRLISGIRYKTNKDKERELKKNSNNNLTYSSIQQNTEFVTSYRICHNLALTKDSGIY